MIQNNVQRYALYRLLFIGVIGISACHTTMQRMNQSDSIDCMEPLIASQEELCDERDCKTYEMQTYQERFFPRGKVKRKWNSEVNVDYYYKQYDMYKNNSLLLKVLSEHPKSPLNPNAMIKSCRCYLSALSSAVLCDKEEVVIFLLDRGADISQLSSDGATALYHAVKKNIPRMALLLLEKGANPNKVKFDTNGLGIDKVKFNADGLFRGNFTPLERAIADKNLEMVELLFEKSKVKPIVSTSTLSMIIIQISIKNKSKKSLDILKLVLDKGSVINVDEKENSVPPLGREISVPPLHTAVEYDNKPVIDLLLNRPEINPNAMGYVYYLGNTHGFIFGTALHKAVSTDNIELVKVLLQSPRLNKDIKDSNGCTPLAIAKKYANRAIIKLLED